MIRSVLVLLLGLTLSAITLASEEHQGLAFPNIARCGEQDKIYKFLDEYQEIGFASGKGILQSAKDEQFYNADVKIYLSNKGTFTVTAEMDKGIVCVLLVGENFAPLIPIEKMH
jgi:hypothetical protein